jgi:aminoglycoside 3-N-acetyltransferase
VRICPGAPHRPSAGVLRAALGPAAAAIASGHDPECHLRERSPLRWLYDADAAILLLGVGYAVCSAFQLAEYRVRGGADVRGADLDDGDFEQIGDAIDEHWRDYPGPGGPLAGRVGMAWSKLIPARTAVSFAVGWMEKYRSGAAHDK